MGRAHLQLAHPSGWGLVVLIARYFHQRIPIFSAAVVEPFLFSIFHRLPLTASQTPCYQSHLRNVLLDLAP
jgi:hypothetical protein